MDPKISPPEWLKWDEETIKSYNKKDKVYSYTYGIKDIQLRNKHFEPASVYVSTPFTIDGNVAEVSLETDEYIPMSNVSSRATNPYDTSIEYYITFSENPTLKDWKPILPKGQERIDNEVLLFKDSPVSDLRFQCDSTKNMSVFKNGIKLNREFWTFGSNNTIKIDRGFDKYSIYTVQYYPNLDVNSPWDIELRDQDREIIPFTGPGEVLGEVFEKGTNRNGTIVLSKYPYIDYSRINNNDLEYQPIRVHLKARDDLHQISAPGGTVTEVPPKPTPLEKDYMNTRGIPVPVVVTNNVTDYAYLTEPRLVPYNTEIDIESNAPKNPEFQYYQEGRNLYFTETFNNADIYTNKKTNHGDASITVSYSYLRTKVRLKTILRNTSNNDNAVTPIVNNYSLIFKVMR